MRSTPAMSDEFAMLNPEAVETAAKTNMVTLTLPFTIPAGIGAFQIPEVQGALNLYGAYEGGSQLFSPDGYLKTIDLWNNGNYGRSILSGAGDAFNIALSTLPFTKTFQDVKSGVNTAREFLSPIIADRFTLQGVRIGDYFYRPSRSTLSMGFPTIERSPIWLLLDLPGYLIKSLFKGSPLERLLSKNGTISVKLLLAYIGRNDVPTIDKELLNRVLLNHSGETHLDYNTLRQEVLGIIPLFTTARQLKYDTYGMKRLGFEINSFPDGAGGLVKTYSGFKPRTFTFESPGIKGNGKHYNLNTLGHSRTYTTADEPDILHVMESLSDWAQSGGVSNAIGKKIAERALDFAKRDLERGNYGSGTKEDLELKIVNLTKLLLSYDLDPILSHMTKTYLNRLLQENLRYAALNGLTKMRYPTSETAAKIEGYTKTDYTPEYQEALDNLSRLNRDNGEMPILPDEIDLNSGISITHTQAQRELLIRDAENKIADLELAQKDRTYAPLHQTILKKYADFPKQYLKLFGKQSEVRIVTDAKGNTWYEVDVPQSYLDGNAEMLFKKGGNLNVVERFKKYRKHKKK